MEKCFKEVENIVNFVDKQKGKLITILLSNVDNETKIKQLRNCLLELRLTKYHNTIDNTSNTPNVLDGLAALETADSTELKFVTEMLNRMYQPILDYQNLLDKLGDVMRMTINNTEKIEKIANMLV